MLSVKIVNSSNKTYTYSTLSLPYYIMNINEDIAKIILFKNSTNICFTNSLVHFENEMKDVIFCPIRDNILLYIKWFHDNIDTIADHILNGKVVESPLIYNEHYYNSLFNLLNGKSINIFTSKFFNNYIESVYIKLADNKNDSIAYDENKFKIVFYSTFKNHLYNYLFKLNTVVNYINIGNFYGNETFIYQQQLEQFKKEIYKDL